MKKVNSLLLTNLLSFGLILAVLALSQWMLYDGFNEDEKLQKQEILIDRIESIQDIDGLKNLSVSLVKIETESNDLLKEAIETFRDVFIWLCAFSAWSVIETYRVKKQINSYKE